LKVFATISIGLQSAWDCLAKAVGIGRRHLQYHSSGPNPAIAAPHPPHRFDANEPIKGDVPQTPFASRASFEIFSLI